VPRQSAIGFAIYLQFSDVSGKPWFSRALYSEAERFHAIPGHQG
jgi:hypothetical protein